MINKGFHMNRRDVLLGSLTALVPSVAATGALKANAHGGSLTDETVFVYSTEQRLHPHQARQAFSQITSQHRALGLSEKVILNHSGMTMKPMATVSAKRGDIQVWGRSNNEVLELLEQVENLPKVSASSSIYEKDGEFFYLDSEGRVVERWKHVVDGAVVWLPHGSTDEYAKTVVNSGSRN